MRTKSKQTDKRTTATKVTKTPTTRAKRVGPPVIEYVDATTSRANRYTIHYDRSNRQLIVRCYYHKSSDSNFDQIAIDINRVKRTLATNYNIGKLSFCDQKTMVMMYFDRSIVQSYVEQWCK